MEGFKFGLPYIFEQNVSDLASVPIKWFFSLANLIAEETKNMDAKK